LSDAANKTSSWGTRRRGDGLLERYERRVTAREPAEDARVTTGSTAALRSAPSFVISHFRILSSSPPASAGYGEELAPSCGSDALGGLVTRPCRSSPEQARLRHVSREFDGG